MNVLGENTGRGMSSWIGHQKHRQEKKQIGKLDFINLKPFVYKAHRPEADGSPPGGESGVAPTSRRGMTSGAHRQPYSGQSSGDTGQGLRRTLLQRRPNGCRPREKAPWSRPSGKGHRAGAAYTRRQGYCGTKPGTARSGGARSRVGPSAQWRRGRRQRQPPR